MVLAAKTSVDRQGHQGPVQRLYTLRKTVTRDSPSKVAEFREGVVPADEPLPEDPVAEDGDVMVSDDEADDELAR